MSNVLSITLSTIMVVWLAETIRVGLIQLDFEVYFVQSSLEVFELEL